MIVSTLKEQISTKTTVFQTCFQRNFAHDCISLAMIYPSRTDINRIASMYPITLPPITPATL